MPGHRPAAMISDVRILTWDLAENSICIISLQWGQNQGSDHSARRGQPARPYLPERPPSACPAAYWGCCEGCCDMPPHLKHHIWASGSITDTLRGHNCRAAGFCYWPIPLSTLQPPGFVSQMSLRLQPTRMTSQTPMSLHFLSSQVSLTLQLGQATFDDVIKHSRNFSFESALSQPTAWPCMKPWQTCCHWTCVHEEWICILHYG